MITHRKIKALFRILGSTSVYSSCWSEISYKKKNVKVWFHSNWQFQHGIVVMSCILVEDKNVMVGLVTIRASIVPRISEINLLLVSPLVGCVHVWKHRVFSLLVEEIRVKTTVHMSRGHERWYCHGRVSIGDDEWVLESRSCIKFNSLDQATAAGPSIL